MRSPITTHVLDTARGVPAAGINVVLEHHHADSETWKELARGTTDADGRIMAILPPEKKLESGTYRLTFETESYFKTSGTKSFYPFVAVTFYFDHNSGHYHVPLLLSPYGYSTYRGS